MHCVEDFNSIYFVLIRRAIELNNIHLMLIQTLSAICC